MREYATPLTADVAAAVGLGNLTDDVVRNGDQHGDGIAFSRRVEGAWQDVTAAQFLGEVRAVAKGLVAAGIEAGDRVGLISRTRYEWTLLDYAIWFAGAATVPIYETSSAEQVEWILSDSGARAVVAETPAHLARIRECRDRLDELHHVWSIEGGAVNVLTRLGADITDDELEARRTKAGPDSLATLIYTSGTTGRPKGCMLTHGNFQFELAVATEELNELFAPSAEEGGGPSTLLFLPLAHVFARIIQVGCVKAGVRMGHSADIKNLLDDFASFEPTFILAVPRVFEKVFNSASQRAIADGRGRIFSRAADVAIAWSRGLETGKIPLSVRAQHRVFDRLVYARLRNALGGRCAYAFSGGAPLGDRLGHFYRGVGVNVLEGY
ncbi:MAG TPA: AMP-binding protein, partial [Marmoricola sp.]